MSPEQCREAREKLNWTRQDLAKIAHVPLWFIAAFEDGLDTAEFLAAYRLGMRRVFEEAGLGFPFEIENGRMRAAGVTYSPLDKSETH
jgi:DNA-binding XRE family transcriptional regulator